MKTKRACACLGIVVVLLTGAVLFGCGSSSGLRLLPRLIALDDNSSADSVNVFNINATSGVLTAVGPAFDLGAITGGTSLDDPAAIAVHPNRHWAYVYDWNNGNIEAFFLDVNGRPIIIGTVIPEGYPFDLHSLAITPDGKFLFAVDGDTYVDVYQINQTTGALTSLGYFDLTNGNANGCSAAVTATNTRLYIGDRPIGACAGNDAVWVWDISSAGAVTYRNTMYLAAPSGPGVLQVDPNGRAIYMGDWDSEWLGAVSLGADGTPDGTVNRVVVPAGAETWNNQIVLSRENPATNLYITTGTGVHGFSIASNSDLTELGSSPYADSVVWTSGLAIDLSNSFVYTTDGSRVYGFNRNAATGELADFTIGNPAATTHTSAYAIGAAD